MNRRLEAFESAQQGGNARMAGLAHTTEKASEKAANANCGLREAARVLGDLGAIVQAQQTTSKTVCEQVQAMAVSHAQETASMAGDFVEIKGAIEALSRRVEEATAGLTIWPELPRGVVPLRSPSPADSGKREAARGVDAGKRLGPMRKKVTLYEQLRAPGVTRSCNAPEGENFTRFPLPSGAVGWHEDAVSWSNYLRDNVPTSLYLGTMVTTIPSTTVQGNVFMPENVGIPSEIRAPAPLFPHGINQTAGPSIQPGQLSHG